jgi:hypothetical protein
MIRRKAIQKKTSLNAKKLLSILHDRDKALKDLSQKIEGLLKSRHTLKEMYADVVRKIKKLNEYSALLPCETIKGDRPLLRMAVTQEISLDAVSPESSVFQQMHYEIMDWLTYDISNDNIMRRAMIFKLISSKRNDDVYFQYNDAGLASLDNSDIIEETNGMLITKWLKVRKGDRS